MKTVTLPVGGMLAAGLADIFAEAHRHGPAATPDSILAQFHREMFTGENAETSGTRIVVRVCIVPAECVEKVHALIEKERAKIAARDAKKGAAA